MCVQGTITSAVRTGKRSLAVRIIRRVSIFPMAIAMCLVSVILYIIGAGVFNLINAGIFGYNFRDTFLESMVNYLPAMCIGYLIGIPISAIGGIIGGALFAFAYNLAADAFGGIELELN